MELIFTLQSLIASAPAHLPEGEVDLRVPGQLVDDTRKMLLRITEQQQQWMQSLLAAPERPVLAYFDAFACSEHGDGPSWANLTLTRAWLMDLVGKAMLTSLLNVTRMNHDEGPERWDQEDSLRLRYDRLVVSDDDFWFEADPKQADYSVRTRSVRLASLVASYLEAIERGTPVLFFGESPDDRREQIVVNEELAGYYCWVQDGDDELSRWYFFCQAVSAEHAQEQALDHSTVIRVLTVFNALKTEDGYTLHVLPDGSLVDSLDPDQCDIKYMSLAELGASVGFAAVPIL